MQDTAGPVRRRRKKNPEKPTNPNLNAKRVLRSRKLSYAPFLTPLMHTVETPFSQPLRIIPNTKYPDKMRKLVEVKSSFYLHGD